MQVPTILSRNTLRITLPNDHPGQGAAMMAALTCALSGWFAPGKFSSVVLVYFWCLRARARDALMLVWQVFCTKRNPNCLSCPLRASCEYARNDGRSLQPQNQHLRHGKAASNPKPADVEDLAGLTSTPRGLAANSMAHGSAGLLLERHIPQAQSQAAEVQQLAQMGCQLQCHMASVGEDSARR